MSSTGGAFSVRFLRNGDQITVNTLILDKNGNGNSLFQVVDSVSGAVAPDWTVEANQPIIQLQPRSAAGYVIGINSVTWLFDGTQLNFTPNGTTWVTASNDARFKYHETTDGYPELKIVGNIAGQNVLANKQITYQINYTSAGITDTFRGTVNVLVHQAGSNSHVVQITTSRTELDSTDGSDETTLTASSYYGVSPVTIGSNGYTIEWYQDGVKLNGEGAATLLVSRDMVSGGSLFVAKLKQNGSVVAQDSQRINDIADTYQIEYEPTNAGSNFVSPAHTASFILSLRKNNQTLSNTGVSFAWQVYNALGVAKTSGTGTTVTVTQNDCLCGDGAGAYYADCDVQVTATFTE